MAPATWAPLPMPTQARLGLADLISILITHSAADSQAARRLRQLGTQRAGPHCPYAVMHGGQA